MITLHVNGQAQSFDGDPSMPVLWYLRDVLGLTGTKFGCGVAACGACTIHLDGDATRTCVTAMSDANGKSITTIEGLEPGRQSPGSKGLARAQRAAVRLLPGRPDHAGRRASETDAPSHGRRHRQQDVRQHLPLRDLSAHSRRHQASCGSLTMTKHLREIEPSYIENVSRRGVLKGIFSTTGLVLAVHDCRLVRRWLGMLQWGADGMPHGTVNNPLAFVSIAPDGTVTIVCHRSEMGQGVRTGMPLIVADEMEADWSRVKIAQATGDEAKYGNQDTDGSRSTRHGFVPMRQVGAAARMMLEAAAAKRWGVDVSDVEAKNHEVIQKSTGKKLGYGELAADASTMGVPTGVSQEKWVPQRPAACSSRILRSSATSARKGPTSSMASTSRPAGPSTVRMSACPARNTPSSRALRSWVARSPPTTPRTRRRSPAFFRSSRFPRRPTR